MSPRDVETRAPESEVKLAAHIRQLMRAYNAGDQVAVREEKIAICSMLAWLLTECLERESSWDAVEQWIDGLTGARFTVEPPDRIAVEGQMVWGLVSEPGGTQWLEPFEAEVQISWPMDGLKAYTLRFAERGGSQESMRHGFYPILDDGGLEGRLHGPLRFSPTDSELERVPLPARSRVEEWKYVISRSQERD